MKKCSSSFEELTIIIHNMHACIKIYLYFSESKFIYLIITNKNAKIPIDLKI